MHEWEYHTCDKWRMKKPESRSCGDDDHEEPCGQAVLQAETPSERGSLQCHAETLQDELGRRPEKPAGWRRLLRSSCVKAERSSRTRAGENRGSSACPRTRSKSLTGLV